MSQWYSVPLAISLVLVWAKPSLAQPEVPKEPYKLTCVKKGTVFGCPCIHYHGVVDKVEDRLVTLTCYHINDEKPKSRTFEAIDVLADGGVLDEPSDAYAYLWSDMKKGDKVDLNVVRDTEEDKQYVVRLMIEGRVNGKVPESQRPDSDVKRLAQCNLLNDINNWLDVDDEEIAKCFPILLLPFNNGEPPAPGGLNKEYQAKLDAIRAKLKKEREKDGGLKATPPEKK